MRNKKFMLSVAVVSLSLLGTACGNLGAQPVPGNPKKQSTSNPNTPGNTSVGADVNANVGVQADAKAGSGAKVDTNLNANAGLQVRINGKKINADLEKVLTVKVKQGLTLSEALKETKLVELNSKVDSKGVVKAVKGVKGSWKLKVNGKVVSKKDLDLKVKNGDKVDLVLDK
ncbi:hypothetical protein [Thermoflavimicrobium dichotomicum]|uniref:DUF4430 domain-containing protein n=1 Tax=Thermoflavimicrobium dichotomicum TaxID=46223 RepID=A0A1I3RQF4_9BACL|nr:hypothetical protein [Thermoflavimicrobium dichotomicum]SFJ47426.1 hypothetical protein SAMN05421852_110103 [Thermoflavimicrobium dichotomicum]